MKTSKLKSFEAKIGNNGQETFQSSYGKTMYVNTIYMENGDTGQANSTKEQPNWKIGEEYNYNIDKKQFDWGTVYQITGLKMVEKEGQQGYQKSGYQSKGGYKKSPQDQKMIQAQVAMICANFIFNKMQEDYDTIAREFLSYLILNSNEANMISIQGCLKISSEYFKELLEPEVTIQQVIEKAKELLIKVERSKSWDGTLDKSTSASLEEQPPSHQNDQLDQTQPEQGGTDPFMKIV